MNFSSLMIDKLHVRLVSFRANYYLKMSLSEAFFAEKLGGNSDENISFFLNFSFVIFE